MQKTNVLQKTIFYLLITLTSFATLFIFTACDLNNKTINDNSGDQPTDTGGSDDTEVDKKYTLLLIWLST